MLLESNALQNTLSSYLERRLLKHVFLAKKIKKTTTRKEIFFHKKLFELTKIRQ
jgi:hypothetical protein